MDVFGAEEVVTAASPFIGKGESACLVRLYVNIMTESEIHLLVTPSKSYKSMTCQGLNLKLFKDSLL